MAVAVNVILAFIILLLFNISEVIPQGTNTAVTTETITTQSITTGTPGTTPSASTTNPSTTPQGTTASTTPPTLPSGTPSPVSRNTDIAECTCDLTSQGCDVNCCCDTDCTDADRAVFSKCVDVYTSPDDQVCMSQSLFFANNTPEYGTLTSGGLFCVYFDNNVDRSYYEPADIIQSTVDFNTYVKKYAGPSYEAPSSPWEGSASFAKPYKSGDPVYTIFPSNAIGRLALPRSLTTQRCDDINPAAYLYDQEFSCVREVTDLGTQCETTPSLAARTFYEGFKVVTAPDRLFANITITVANASAPNVTIPDTPDLNNSSDLTAISLQTVKCLDTTGIEVACSFNASATVAKPVYVRESDTCDNVVKEVHYIVTYDSSTGIDGITVDFTVQTVTKNHLPLKQTFKTAFTKVGEVVTAKRSGNPGYIVDQPLLVGEYTPNTILENAVEQTVYAIEVNQNSQNSLSLVAASVNGQCTTDINNRVVLKFGMNMRSGCMIRVSLQNISKVCQLIQAEVRAALVGSMSSLTRIATFGNSDPNKVGDWIPIVNIDQEFGAVNGLEGECQDIVLSLHLDIIYVNVGSLANPQPKVIGASAVFGRPQTIRYQCIGPYCQPESQSISQAFEVTTSVAFIDASKPAVLIEAEPPVFSAKLPNDFFYPFTSTATGAMYTSTLTSLIITLLQLLS